MYKSSRKRKSTLLKAKKKSSALRSYSTLRCPVNGHQVSWCRGLCRPSNGTGICGRPAPHAMQDRTQKAISRYLRATARKSLAV